MKPIDMLKEKSNEDVKPKWLAMYDWMFTFTGSLLVSTQIVNLAVIDGVVPPLWTSIMIMISHLMLVATWFQRKYEIRKRDQELPR